MIPIVLTAAMLAAEPPSVSQSFDCAKAQTRVEKLICSDAGLRELDEHLGRYYEAGRAVVERAASCLQGDQAQWLKTIRNQCADASCLKAAYLDRLGSLDALQPGATAIRNIALPRVPSLVWIIAPASDTVAAPANPKATPFEAIGPILNEVSGGDGFMLQTRDRGKVPLVLLMFMEGNTPELLSALAKEKNATFRARGFAAMDGSRTYFEPSRCTFIYRMPTANAPNVEAGPQSSSNVGAGLQSSSNVGAGLQPRPPAKTPTVPQDLEDMEKLRKSIVTQGKVCPDPNRPCEGFKPNELSFAIAQPFKFDRGRDRSQPFFAVILKSGPLCGIDDTERVKAQQQFPAAKVFLHRHMCEDFGDKVTYSNINEKSGFVAVYGGETEVEARNVLAEAKAAGYPGANLRRMAVIVVYQIE
jgi:uncharacterized protein